MYLELTKILQSIIAFQFFFFGAIVLFIQPRQNYNNWLSAFLFFNAVAHLLILEGKHFHWFSQESINTLMYIPITFIYCPILYVFVLKASNQKFNFWFFLLPILIPILIAYTLYLLPAAYWENNSLLGRILWDMNYRIQSIYFLVLAYKRYLHFKNALKDFYSQDTIQRLFWIKIIILGFIILWIISVAMSVIVISFSDHEDTLIFTVLNLIYLCAILLILFVVTKQRISATDLPVSTNIKYSFSSLSDSDKDVFLQKLNSFMVAEKYYRTSNLNLKTISDKLNIQVKHLSQVINECHNKNFCEYINSLRLEDAKRQLENPIFRKKTVLEIMYETGFNSKSVFYTIFKGDTGLTPTAFRKQKMKI